MMNMDAPQPSAAPAGGNFAAFLLDERAPLWPERTALRCRGRSVTYAELSRLSRAMGSFLASRGAVPGDRVLIVLPDSFSFVAGFLGTLLAGAVAVLVNPRLLRCDYEDCLRECAPRLVLAPPGHAALEAAADGPAQALPLDDDILPGLVEGLPGCAPHPARGEDLCAFLVTSGTTGHPKIVPHRQRDFFIMSASNGAFMGCEPGDTILCSAKMSHAYGFIASLAVPLRAGATVALDPEKPDPLRTLELLEREKVTYFASVPVLFAMILLAAPEPHRLRSLKRCLCTGEVMPDATFRAWKALTGLDAWQGYGTTEAMALVLGDTSRDIAPGRVGRPIPPYEVEVLDPQGRPAPEGAPGHLVLRGPSLTTGYLNDPQRSAELFTPDGFLFTGDMAVRENGRFAILGRMNDMFKAGGLWVSPTRVEDVLLTHPGVGGCAVTGGLVAGHSLVQAHVVPRPGAAPGPELADDIRAHAARGLPDFMVPAEILFHESLPLTASGKVQRFKLRNQHPTGAR